MEPAIINASWRLAQWNVACKRLRGVPIATTKSVARRGLLRAMEKSAVLVLRAKCPAVIILEGTNRSLPMGRAKKRTEMTAEYTLHWVSVKRFQRAYELRSGTKVIGRLRWPHLLGSLAEAEYGEERWTFKRGGFLTPRVTVRRASSDADVAVLGLAWGGSGTLSLAGGTRYRWERQGFWSRTFLFSDQDGAPLVLFEPKLGLLRRTADVKVSKRAVRMHELGIMVTLGWYVILLITDDEAAATAATCSG